jgi:hypothetical protein
MVSFNPRQKEKEWTLTSPLLNFYIFSCMKLGGRERERERERELTSFL